MKIDFKQHDGLVQLAADKRRGVWGSQMLLRVSGLVTAL